MYQLRVLTSVWYLDIDTHTAIELIDMNINTTSYRLPVSVSGIDMVVLRKGYSRGGASQGHLSSSPLFLHCNHKTLGPYYIYTSLVLGVSGSLYSILLRLELHGSSNRVISPENQYFYPLSHTLHGILMIFYMVMPGMIGGLGNYMIPIYLGASEVGFPRTNGYSLLLLFPVSISLILVASVTEFPGGTG